MQSLKSYEIPYFVSLWLEELLWPLPVSLEIDRSIAHTMEEKKVPEFMSCLGSRQLKELDVRPVLASGEDPLNIIMSKIKTIEPGGVLKVINSFEPTPLILLLEKKGFETYVENISTDHINTYFLRKGKSPGTLASNTQNTIHDWDDVAKKYDTRISQIDVRQMEM